MVELRPRSSFPFLGLSHPYRTPVRPSRVLDSNYFELVELAAENDPVDSNGSALHEEWAKRGRSQKWLHYFPAYEAALAHFGNRPIRML